VMLSSLFCCFTFYIYIKDQFGVNFCITCEIGLFFFSWPWLLNFSTPFIEKKKRCPFSFKSPLHLEQNLLGHICATLVMDLTLLCGLHVCPVTNSMLSDHQSLIVRPKSSQCAMCWLVSSVG
jgi:hypothetical protein